MNQILLFFHFIGLVLAWGPGIATGVTMQVAAAAPPAEAAGIRKLPPILARVGSVGLALLWITGPIMVWSVYGGPAGLPTLFMVKFTFVLALTVIFGLMQLRFRDIKRGNIAAAAQLPILGIAASGCAFFAVLFATLAFDPH